MLLDPGPLTLFVESDFPIPGPRGEMETAAAGEVSALMAHADALLGPQLEIAGAGDAGIDAQVGALLGAASAELDRQSRESDSSIAGAVTGAAVLEGDLAGLTNEVGNDLHVDVPDEPAIPPGADNPSPGVGPNPPEQPTAPPDDQDAPDNKWPPTAPVARDGSGSDGSGLVGLYQGYLRNDLSASYGRSPYDWELQLPVVYAARYGYIDNSAYNWLLSTFVR